MSEHTRIDFRGWFEQNDKRSILKKIIQLIWCRNGHDNKYHYLSYRSGKISDIHDSAICRRCNHLQLYGIPLEIRIMLEDG